MSGQNFNVPDLIIDHGLLSWAFCANAAERTVTFVARIMSREPFASITTTAIRDVEAWSSGMVTAAGSYFVIHSHDIPRVRDWLNAVKGEDL